MTLIRMNPMKEHTMSGAFVLIIPLATLLAACEVVEGAVEEVEDANAAQSEVTGLVTDNRGAPIGGATIELYNLVANTNFVEGGDIGSAEAYIDREAILASSNALATAQTAGDGTFLFEGVFPSAFLVVASKEGCTADFAGFDEETGVLNEDTLIFPDEDLDFSVPTLVLACATPPEVGPDGNSDDAPPFDPPAAHKDCDAELCTAAGGTCEGVDCVVTCRQETCSASGGSCDDGVCVLPNCDATACAELGGTCEQDVCVVTTCDESACSAAAGTCSQDGTSCDIPPCLAAEGACESAGGECSEDGTRCELPACTSDADCEAGQFGAFCANPGDIELAECRGPLPDEILPPDDVGGWTSFGITDTDDNLLADASEGNQVIEASDIPASGLVRVYAEYEGDASRAYVHVQTGSQVCPELPPRTDYIAVDLVDGALEGGFVEVYLHGGHQKIAISTSDVLGEGEQTHVVEVGEACRPPQHPFVAILTWSAGPSQPADLDLNVWSSAGDLIYIGRKQAAWGQLVDTRQGPGPEIFRGDDVSEGPFTIKVLFFSGRPRAIEAKVRIIRVIDGVIHDDSFLAIVEHPKDIAEIGVFASQ